MSVIRYQRPAYPVNRLFDEFFNTDFSRVMGSESVNRTARANVLEKEDRFEIEIAAPGLRKEDFQLSLDKDQLSIKVEREQANEENQGRYTRREFSFERFSRSFQLPKTVNQEAIGAKYENGILTIGLPKKEEAVIVKKEITIE